MWSRNLTLVVLALALSACDKEERTNSESTASSEPTAPTKAALDPDLAQAVAAASAGLPGAAKAPGGADGPPPNGIFAPGEADKQIRAGEAPKLTLGSDGSDPKVSLLPAQPKPGSKQSGTVRVSIQNPPQGALPIDFGVTFEAQKPKGENGEVEETPVLVRITSARLAVSGAPRDIEDRIAKLKGAKVEYLVEPDGGASGFRFEVPKGVQGEFADSVRALAESIALFYVPFPKQPVGAGAYWMATSRDGVLGLDLVSYRLVKVERVTGNRVILDVNTKRYAAGTAFDLPGLPPDVPKVLAEFQALAQGKVEVEAGKGFPMGGNQESALGAGLGTAPDPRQRMMLEMRTRSEVAMGGATLPPLNLRQQAPAPVPMAPAP